jgi:hypothetical protein
MRRKLVFFTLSLGLTAITLAPQAEAWEPCVEGSTRRFPTGSCCSLDRSQYEIWQCQGGIYGPTGQYGCGGICIES